ncbi:MAG: hypothetical protein C4521_12935 [Actinobacteria bacterium]|nr:MAG: hypothetical protein C4521_12935 [Actinomycetota bacterium]
MRRWTQRKSEEAAQPLRRPSEKPAGEKDACEMTEGEQDMRQGRDAQLVQCPLCGNRFEPVEAEACKYCPKLFKSCGMLACPNCSHEFPRP